MGLESHLRDALGQDERPTFDVRRVELIRRNAAWRRRRRIGSLGAVALIAVVGIGLFASSGRSEAPSAVFVSEDSADPAATPTLPEPDVVGITSTISPIAAPPAISIVPVPQTVVHDPGRGFVGVARRILEPGEAERNVIVASTDGVHWAATHTWDHGAFRVEALRRVGADWMAVLRTPDREFRGPDTTTSVKGTIEVAFSDDLATWRHVEVPLDFEERVIRARVTLDDVVVHPMVVGAGRVGDRVAVNVRWFLTVEPDRAATACGDGLDPRGFFVIACDGSIDVLLDRNEVESLGALDVELYVGSLDGPIELDPSASGLTLTATEDSFVGLRAGSNEIVRSVDARTWSTVTTLAVGPEVPGPWMLASDTFDGSVGLYAEANGGSGLRVAIVDAASGDTAVRSVPVQVDPALTDGTLRSGADGWSVLLNQRRFSTDGIVDNGWRLVAWQYAPFERDDRFVLTPRHRDPMVHYSFSSSSELVERGVFGEIRVRLPGSDEYAIDHRSGGRMLAHERLLRATDPRSRFEQGGWSISGDPLSGPLVVVDPDGERRILDDGYDMLDGDVSDGVELLALTENGHDTTGTLALFDGSEMVWSVPWSDVVDALSVELGSLLRDRSAPGDSWLVTSVDGRAWEVSWSERDAGFGEWPRIVVGDDVVLVQRFTSDPNPFVAISPSG